MSDSTQENGISDDALHKFVCPACGGSVAFDASTQKLKCRHCETLSPLPPMDGIIEELGLNEARRQGVGKGLGISLKSLRCESCGAITSFDDSNRAVKCAFCDSNHVIREESSDPSIIRPASLIPFQVDRAKALEAFGTWVKGLWFKPNDLKKMWSLKQIRGVYVPFWTFDAQTQSRWTAKAGYHYYKTEHYTEEVNGEMVHQTRQVQHTRWEHASGFDSHFFDDELVVASKGLAPSLIRKLYPFNTGMLQLYQPSFLAGWEAERYQIDLKEGWTIGRQLMDNEIHRRCAAKVPGDTHRNLSVSSQFTGVTFKHILLPVWIAAYHYKGKLFQFLVNGQTGKVSGTSPKSWVKITLVIVVIVAIIAAYLYLA